MEILVQLHGRGETILLVTHERDIAAFAGRLITLMDGMVERDERHNIGEPVA
jgi:ABC-type lipoprotein export system ATPase subunit